MSFIAQNHMIQVFAEQVISKAYEDDLEGRSLSVPARFARRDSVSRAIELFDEDMEILLHRPLLCRETYRDIQMLLHAIDPARLASRQISLRPELPRVYMVLCVHACSEVEARWE